MTLQISDSILRKIPKLYKQEYMKDPIVYLKLFTPWTSWTWLITEYDGSNIFFGYVIGLSNEFGYFSKQEIEDIKGPGGLEIEVDMHFKPKRLSEAKQELEI